MNGNAQAFGRRDETGRAVRLGRKPGSADTRRRKQPQCHYSHLWLPRQVLEWRPLNVLIRASSEIALKFWLIISDVKSPISSQSEDFFYRKMARHNRDRYRKSACEPARGKVRDQGTGARRGPSKRRARGPRYPRLPRSARVICSDFMPSRTISSGVSSSKPMAFSLRPNRRNTAFALLCPSSRATSSTASHWKSTSGSMT